MWQSYRFPDTILETHVGRDNQINASEIQPVGRIPVVDQGQALIAGYTDDESRVIRDDLPLIIFGDHTRCFKYVDFPFVIGADGTKVLKPDPALFDARFYYFALLSLDIQSRGYNRHFVLLKEKTIPRPELDEQRRIARVLTTVTDAITQEERVIALTNELKRAVIRKVFSEGLRGERQKQTEIGPLPESWEVVRLRDRCSVVMSSLSYKQLSEMEEDSRDDTVEVFGIKVSDMNLPGNETMITRANLVRRVDRATALSKTVAPVTIVFPKRGAAIATNKKRLTSTWAVFDPNLIGVQPKEGIEGRFLYYWFLQFDLSRITDLGLTPQLNKKDLDPLLIPVPAHYSEQVDSANMLDSVEKKIRVHGIKREKLSELFRTLLHELMTAQIRMDSLEL